MKQAIVYGSETRAMTELDMNRRHVGEENVSIKYYGLAVEQGIWRIRTVRN